MTSKRRKGLFTLAVLLFALSERALESGAQLSGKGIAANEHVGNPGNKFLNREADLNLDGTNESDEASSFPKCSQNVEMRWMAEVSSSVYATPLITDLFSDGHKDVIVPSFVHYLEVLEGDEGVQTPGWPAFHKSLVHASPLLYDIDFDGTQEILLATYNGEILFFRETGEQVESHKMLVPRLRVRKDWFAGLAADHVDHSQPDVGAEGQGAEGGVAGQGGAAGASRRRTLLQQGQGSDSVLQQEQQQRVADPLQSAENRNEQTAESLESMQLFEDYGDLYDAQAQAVDDGRGDNAGGMGMGDYSEDPAFMHDPNDPLLFLDYEDQFLEHQLRASGGGKTSWEDEEYKQAPHQVEGGYLYVDSHILCNPTIADLDGNGQDELIVAVSYFFDRDYYGEPSHKAELGEDVDVSKYVASGVIVFDLPTRTVKWSQHLDLSTDQVRYRAFAYSPPTAADLDGDGKLEVLLGTSVGFLYVLGHDGQLREGWPVLMGEIQGQVLAADVNNDGRVEVFAGDSRGSVALFNADGKEIWEQHLRSMVAQGATLADVDGDGQLEIVFGTAGGFVYALNALTGRPIAGFPFKTHGRVLAPVLAVQLEEGPGLHVVVMSFDGHLYMISGSDACADVVDIGEPSYSMVLADDLDGNGRMDLLVSTMNGVLYSFETGSAYHPLKSWTSQYMGPGAAARSNWAGIYATEASRRPQDMKGSSFLVQFIIKDDRPPLPLDSTRSAADIAAGNTTAGGMRRGPYPVRAVLQGVGVGTMNSGEQPVIGMSEVFAAPGQYQLELPCPLSRTSATILLEMRDSTGLVFSDSYALSFHYHFHKLFKWLLVGPLATMLVLLLAFRHVVDVERLPS